MLRLVDVTKEYRIKTGGSLNPKYQKVKALEKVNLSIPTGETLTILGPNGAGKSTICKIAAGMTKPTKGTALLEGVDITRNIRTVSKRIGVVLGPTLIYYRLTGYSYLKFFAKVYEVEDYDKRILELAELLGLGKWLNAYIESYSLGMKMKISLARALVHDPALLILDEFSMGLDPIAAREIRDFVRGLKRTVLLTTHNTTEAQAMSDKIAFISKGRMVTVDSLGQLLKAVAGRTKVIVSLIDGDSAKKELSAMDGVAAVHEKQEGEFELLVSEFAVSALFKVLSKHGVTSVKSLEPSLEEAYAIFTGEKLSVDIK